MPSSPTMTAIAILAGTLAAAGHVRAQDAPPAGPGPGARTGAVRIVVEAPPGDPAGSMVAEIRAALETIVAEAALPAEASAVLALSIRESASGFALEVSLAPADGEPLIADKRDVSRASALPQARAVVRGVLREFAARLESPGPPAGEAFRPATGPAASFDLYGPPGADRERPRMEPRGPAIWSPRTLRNVRISAHALTWGGLIVLTGGLIITQIGFGLPSLGGISGVEPDDFTPAEQAKILLPGAVIAAAGLTLSTIYLVKRRHREASFASLEPALSLSLGPGFVATLSF